MPKKLTCPETLKVLIVDDDPVDRAIFKQYLEDSQPGAFLFAEAISGEDGLTRCVDFMPDCILLDFNLPDLDGVSVLRQLKEGAEELPFPVVMLTAIGNERIAVEAMKLGVMDYLAKGPAASDILPRTVRNAIVAFSMRREIDRQRAALVEEKERYRTLTEAMPQLVWTVSPAGSIEYANEQLRAFTGAHPGEGWNLIGIVEEQDQARFKAGWEWGTGGGRPFELEVRLRRNSDGAVRRHLLRAVPLTTGGNRTVRWIGTCTDIEDQKLAEEAIRQQQKLDSIGLLAGGIAHDFNNLLVGIMGGTSFALDTVAPGHPARPMLEIAVRSSERAAQLTRQLLAYAGKGEMFVEPVDMAQVVRDSCELVRASMPRTTLLKWNAQPDMPLMLTSPAQIQQVIMNLVINAAEAIGDKNGAVSVDIRLVQSGRNENYKNLLGYQIPTGEYVDLTVADTGCGMDDATMARIFDPFFTTKFTGRGLGLAAVQGIVRALYGGIMISTAVNKGTSFRLLLPAKRARSTAACQAYSRPLAYAADILVIDDEEIVQKTVRSCLEKSGHHVLTAEDGPSGLDLLRRHQDRIGLILLDLSMPRMSGIEVFHEIRKRSPSVPVAIMSGYSERELTTQFEGADVAGFVQKPFTAQSIGDAVSGILDQISDRHHRNTGGGA